MKMLVIGLGEVGSAIKEILSEQYAVESISAPNEQVQGTHAVLHICFPFFEMFIDEVREYQQKYLTGGGLTIIHSTVPVGTSDQCNAVHSPVRGMHPNMVPGLKTFVKYFGGARAQEAADIFERIGIQTHTTPDAKNTEALKIFDTTYYAWNVIFEKELKKWCDAHDVDFDLVYTDANSTYNDGYKKLGRQEVRRPVLRHMDGKIGGHCLIENCRLLDSEIAEIILKKNEDY